jgi:hypothetical protein
MQAFHMIVARDEKMSTTKELFVMCDNIIHVFL